MHSLIFCYVYTQYSTACSRVYNKPQRVIPMTIFWKQTNLNFTFVAGAHRLCELQQVT